MTCYYPVDAWKSRTLNESGKRSIVFNPRDGYQDWHLQVPCGKCVGCAADRALYWSLRIHHEASLHERNSFVTLTYQDPPPEKISKEHLQLFFKKARHDYSFRYFAVGEYGSKTRRPHYHAIIFGEDFRKASEGVAQINEKLYTNANLAKLWGHGLVSVGDVTIQSASYVAGYCNKKIGDPDTFCIMSRGSQSGPFAGYGGIGHRWLDKYKDDLVRTGVVVIEGREFPIPPRYFSWDIEEDLQIQKEKRQEIFRNMSPEEVIARRASLANKELNRKALLSAKEESI